jgi:hypothetical protein
LLEKSLGLEGRQIGKNGKQPRPHASGVRRGETAAGDPLDAAVEPRNLDILPARLRASRVTSKYLILLKNPNWSKMNSEKYHQKHLRRK